MYDALLNSLKRMTNYSLETNIHMIKSHKEPNKILNVFCAFGTRFVKRNTLYNLYIVPYTSNYNVFNNLRSQMQSNISLNNLSQKVNFDFQSAMKEEERDYPTW